MQIVTGVVGIRVVTMMADWVARIEAAGGCRGRGRGDTPGHQSTPDPNNPGGRSKGRRGRPPGSRARSVEGVGALGALHSPAMKSMRITKDRRYSEPEIRLFQVVGNTCEARNCTGRVP
jgi:hypothetical protein